MMGDERAILERYLRGRGFKMTKARETVLSAFLGLESHVSADAVYEAARAIDPGIGQATVFRTIKLLADAGLAREACRDDGARRYEHAYNHAHHDHLTCVACGAVVEFVDSEIERAQDSVYKRFGFESSGHRLELFGVCPDCAKAAPGRADRS
ncbi:MAG: transcriptional repressor [Spirochaetes bacterium]|nr:transcriptional repressor [Spirochaetota bacterium]MBU1080135.1 transcriptional repressor [Spirochaetota bacterium]